MKPRIGTVRSLAAPDDGTTTEGARRRTVAYYGRTVARNIVIAVSKSILLQCNKLNYGLIFSCFRAVRGCRTAAHRPRPKAQVHGARYAEQIPALWRFGPVEIADHTRDDSMDAIATRILAAAPPRFALAGLSMGGFIALTIMRHAPERVQKLALLDTSARPETPEQTARRKPQIALAKAGRFAEVPALQFPVFVHRNRQNDEALRGRVRVMAEETGPETFLRQQNAIMTRADARPLLPTIRCPTLVLVGD